jgi:hypothetical protein
MSIFGVLAIVAAVGAVAALVSGIASMACDGEVAHRRSEQWMGWRVACQAAALLLVLVGVSATASTAQTESASGDCVYDYRGMTMQECRAYRAKVLQAKSESERIELRDRLHQELAARTKNRNVDLNDWRGLAAPVGATR